MAIDYRVTAKELVKELGGDENIMNVTHCATRLRFILKDETNIDSGEAARYISNLKIGGKIIVNSQQIDPMPVITGAASYPAEVLTTLREMGAEVQEMDALTLAMEAGSSKAVNIVLMGRLARYLGIPEEKWIAAIETTVAPAFVELNKKAFALGYSD